MGKKSKKKQPDTRGFSTTSVLQKKVVKEAPTIDSGVTDAAQSIEDVLCLNTEPISLTQEERETQQRISSEIIHLKKFNIQSAYQGQLFPALPVESSVSVAIPTVSLLHQLISRAKSVKEENKYLTDYFIPSSSWTYERAIRVIHALCGSGISSEVACQSLLATRGYDERASVEHALLNHSPCSLPKGWCDLPIVSTGRESLVAVESAEGSEPSSAKKILQGHKEKEKKHYENIQQAKKLVAVVQQENDERMFTGTCESTSAEDMTTEEASERYKELQSYSTLLRSNAKYLDKKEKSVLDKRMREVKEKLSALTRGVDFQLIKGAKAEAEKTEDITKANAEQGHVDRTKGEGEGNDQAITLDGVTEHVTDEEGGLLGLFEEEDDDQPDICNDPPPVIFQYIQASKSQRNTPQKILESVVTDFRTFESVGEKRVGVWRECVTVGPLSSATAKRLGHCKGTLFSITPVLYSKDQSSARELACLRLMYEMLVSGSVDREKATQKMCGCALKQWNEWITQDESEKERLRRQEATQRVSAAESSVNDNGRPVHGNTSKPNLISSSRNDNTGQQHHENHRRVPQSLALLQREIRKREENNHLPLEGIRHELPVVKKASYVAELIAKHEVSIICGETGSGKSTQVPQIIIRDTPCTSFGDEVINIIITEPRRVAAVSVSQRVGEELGDGGSLRDALSGYTVRLDSRVGPKCVVEYVTVGVLLRRIQSSKGSCLAGYSHVIVDEVHERSVDSDLLLMMLKEYRQQAKEKGLLLRRNGGENQEENDKHEKSDGGKFPRIVMMSATADVDAIADYWGMDGRGEDVEKDSIVDGSACGNGGFAVAHISGRTFPVAVSYLEEAIASSRFNVDQMDGRSVLGDRGEDNHVNFVEQWEEDASEEDEVCGDGENVLSSKQIAAAAGVDMSRVNYELVFQVLKYEMLRCDSSLTVGAVLVFMPGLHEIQTLARMVDSDTELSRLCETVPMHSSLSFQELQRAFRRPGKNKRKLVISTNICETGVTIEDVDLVIDTGFVKSLEWNQVTEISRLRLHLCSIAEAAQRRGRAGRVRPGRCVHLFPRHYVEGTQIQSQSQSQPQKEFRRKMTHRPDPEMKRAPLTNPILSLVDQGFRPYLLLSCPGNVLAASKLQNATRTLIDLGVIVASPEACVSDGSLGSSSLETIQLLSDGVVENAVITSDTSVGKPPSKSAYNVVNGGQDIVADHYHTTPLGRRLALLPCSPASGIILIAACKLNCLYAATIYVASFDCKSIFLTTSQSISFFGQKFGKSTDSDAAAIVNVFSEWRNAESKHKWCQVNNVSQASLSHLDKVANDLLKVVGRQEEKDNAKGFTPCRHQPNQLQCHTCITNVGMHTCVTGGGSLESLHAAIAAGAGKNIAYCATADSTSIRKNDKEKPPQAMYLSGNKSTTFCRIHASSLVAHPGRYVVYQSQMKNQSGIQSLLTVSSINIFTALLFIPWVKYYIGDGTIIIGRGIGVKCKPQTLVALRRLKDQWERSMITDDCGGDDEDMMRLIKELICLKD